MKIAGHEVEFATLKDKEIKFYKCCLDYQKIGKCVINDGVNKITKKNKNSDVIAWTIPVYQFHLCNFSARKKSFYLLQYIYPF